MTPEGRITNRIKHTLKGKYGGDLWIVKIHGSASQETGIPDLIGCLHGILFAIEVKVPGKESTLSARQRFQLERIERAGGISIVASSTSEAETALEKALDELVSTD